MERKRIRFCVILLSVMVLFIASCSFTYKSISIKRTIPVNRYESPEVSGENHNLSFGRSEALRVILTDNIVTAHPDANDPSFETGNVSMHRYTYGINSFLELGINLAISSEDSILGLDAAFDLKPVVKLQVLGEPMNKSQPGNLSLAFVASASSSSQGEDAGDDSNVLISTGTYGSYTSDWNTMNGSAIFGYRLSKSFLIYTNYLSSITEYSGTWKEKDGETDKVVDSNKFSGNIRTTGPSIGLRFGEQFFSAMVEFSFINTKSGNTNYNSRLGGIVLGFTF